MGDNDTGDDSIETTHKDKMTTHEKMTQEEVAQEKMAQEATTQEATTQTEATIGHISQ